MDRLSTVDVFREIVKPNSSRNMDVQERLRQILTDEELRPALRQFRVERGEVMGNFALAAIALGSGHINPQNIEATAKNTRLDEFGGVFPHLARGHTPAEIVSSPLGYPLQEVEAMVNALAAAGIFDAAQNDLHPDVIKLLGNLLRHQPPTALAGRRRSQLFGK